MVTPALELPARAESDDVNQRSVGSYEAILIAESWSLGTV